MNEIISSETRSDGVVRTFVRFEGRTYLVREVGGKVSTVTLTEGIDGETFDYRVTKGYDPTTYYGVVGFLTEAREAPTADPELSMAKVALGISVGFDLNLVGEWGEAQLRALVTAKIDEALSTIDTMTPEGGGGGEGSGFLVVDVHWNDLGGWDIERA